MFSTFNPEKPFNSLPFLPPKNFTESKAILKQLILSHKALAELKGYSELLPNKNIILSSITIKEAKDSSEIENIITSHDELFRAIVLKRKILKPEIKEVLGYRRALYRGIELIKEKELITTNIILTIQQEIEQNNAGIRKLPGTKLVNGKTGAIIYTPPDNEEVILKLLKNLEDFINTDCDNFDPLTKMAMIHYQFESIHPFYDANGRTGRIINVLYLVLKNLLNEAFLYLSGYIIKHKSEYYELLRNVTTEDRWEQWILFMLKAIEETSKHTLLVSKKIVDAMERAANEIRSKKPKVYSRELVNVLFTNVYTKIFHLVDAKIASRNIASGYLDEIESIGIVKSEKVGRERIFINKKLFEILKEN